MKLHLTTTLLCSLLAAASLCAQNQFNGWLSVYTTIKTGKKTSLRGDIQVRSSDQIRQEQSFTLQPSFDFRLNSRWLLSAGYSFVDSKTTVNSINGYMAEHRLWEQLSFIHTGRTNLLRHRVRVEERWLGKPQVVNNKLKNRSFEQACRFRYNIRDMIPFTRDSVFKKGAYAVLQDEIFLNVGNTAAVNGKCFDQNRLYAGGGYRFSTKADVELDYINQFIEGKRRTSLFNHVIQLTFYFRV